MSDKELIKQEVERRINDLKGYVLQKGSDQRWVTAIDQLTWIKAFIDSLPEEPASEDLEEEYNNYFKKHEMDIVLNPYTNCKDIARHFAEWQKKKDQETIELAEDHAMLAGMNKMKEEMMKDAADSKITTDGNSIFPIIKYQLPLTYDCKIGDKVKLIIIKEEQQ